MTEKETDLIEKYLTGKLPEDQHFIVEDKIASDTQFADEFHLQKSIIEGVKTYRKTQLKARLDAVDVSPGFLEFAQQSTLVKSFGGIAIASLIGAGVYFYSEITETNQNITVSYPKHKSFEYHWDLKEFEVSTTTRSEEKKITDSPQPVQVKSIPKVVETEESTAEDQKAIAFEPSIVLPKVNDVQDKAPSVEGLEELDLAGNTTKNKEIDIEAENTKSVKVRYKYYDGKLFLSGDFDKAPYEILEINSAKSRRIFIKYLDKYYRVETTDKLTDLPEVTDPQLLEELKLLKELK
jgi:hypothetical protein